MVRQGKAATLPKFSDTLTLSQSEGAPAQSLALPHLIFFVITPLKRQYNLSFPSRDLNSGLKRQSDVKF